MKYFDTYTSNTLAGSANQFFFETEDENMVYTSRTFYKIFAGGEYNYSILFSNIIDSTFADGSVSRANRVLDGWTIEGARILKSSDCNMTEMAEVKLIKEITFDNKTKKQVAPGEFFASDPVLLSFESGEYLCLELDFKGKTLPYHDESVLPSFVLKDGQWMPSKLHPFAGMIGCDRPVKERVVFWGDSITQGIGAAENSYKHWNALVAEETGKEYSYWNLGIGYGRATDAATLGAWMFKAKNAERVVLCFGVNDIMKNVSAEDIKKALSLLVKEFKKAGTKVLVQTVPPFDYSEEKIKVWNDVNSFILNELSKEADAAFDAAAVLGKSKAEPQIAVYGGHPNEEGSKKWAEALLPVMRKFLEI